MTSTKTSENANLQRGGFIIEPLIVRADKLLQIYYGFYNTSLGRLIVASTTVGICAMAFAENDDQALTSLKEQFPGAIFEPRMEALHQNAIDYFMGQSHSEEPIVLHLKGTPLQLLVWEALLNIPPGTTTTYGALANQLGRPKAARAVGSAIGRNSVALLVPCHRVIPSSGAIGGYRWGSHHKKAILEWEKKEKV